MKRLLETIIILIVWLASVSLAEAINVTVAEVQNGQAVVAGNKAEKSASITWETTYPVGQTTKGGSFSFSSVVPADCVGTLSIGGAEPIYVTLANCTPPTAGILKTGQTACYDVDGSVFLCAGTGQDGEFQKGVTRSYTDNSDGTITDNSTRLIWEKLTSDATIHNANNYYTWYSAFGKIAALNTTPCFAGHCDWRLPNINELQSLVDYGRVNPAINPVFFSPGVGLFPQSSGYWSSTTGNTDLHVFPPIYQAWFVNFFDGKVDPFDKNAASFNDVFVGYVRAVRGP